MDGGDLVWEVVEEDVPAHKRDALRGPIGYRLGTLDGGREWRSALNKQGMTLLQEHGVFETTGEKADASKTDAFHKKAMKYVQAIRADIRNRFSSENTVAAFSVFDPRREPSVGSTELQSYGEDEIQTILRFYGKEAHVAVDKDKQGKEVPAFYAKRKADRERRGESLVAADE
eukprot:gene613-2356_t